MRDGGEMRTSGQQCAGLLRGYDSRRTLVAQFVSFWVRLGMFDAILRVGE